MKSLLRTCDKPMHRRTIEGVSISEISSQLAKEAGHDPRFPFHVTITFEVGLGAVFRYRTEKAAQRTWRKLTGMGL